MSLLNTVYVLIYKSKSSIEGIEHAMTGSALKGWISKIFKTECESIK